MTSLFIAELPCSRCEGLISAAAARIIGLPFSVAVRGLRQLTIRNPSELQGALVDID
jgi:hypothetical protein